MIPLQSSMGPIYKFRRARIIVSKDPTAFTRIGRCLITRVRWVVQCANGHIKQLKHLDKTVPKTFNPVGSDFVRFVCALCNAFRDPLAPVDDQNSPLIKKKSCKNHNNQTNSLHFCKRTIHKRTLFRELNEDDPELVNFPKVSVR